MVDISVLESLPTDVSPQMASMSILSCLMIGHDDFSTRSPADLGTSHDVSIVSCRGMTCSDHRLTFEHGDDGLVRKGTTHLVRGVVVDSHHNRKAVVRCVSWPEKSADVQWKQVMIDEYLFVVLEVYGDKREQMLYAPMPKL